MIPKALDAPGRPAQVSNAAIQSAPLVQRAYTPDGLTASLTVARDNTTFNVTNFAYDGLNRRSTTTYPDSSTVTFGYDADGNVLTRQTRASQTVTFTYDTLNRRERHQRGSHGARVAVRNARHREHELRPAQPAAVVHLRSSPGADDAHRREQCLRLCV